MLSISKRLLNKADTNFHLDNTMKNCITSIGLKEKQKINLIFHELGRGEYI